MNTQTRITSLLASLSKVRGIDQVSGDIIPLPGNDGATTEHLFINLYRSIPEGDNPKILLSILRGNAQETIQLIAESVKPFLYDSLIVSIYNKSGGENSIRLYRTRVDGKDIPSVHNQYFTGFAQGEESRYPLIRDLLSIPPTH